MLICSCALGSVDSNSGFGSDTNGDITFVGVNAAVWLLQALVCQLCLPAFRALGSVNSVRGVLEACQGGLDGKTTFHGVIAAGSAGIATGCLPAEAVFSLSMHFFLGELAQWRDLP